VKSIAFACPPNRFALGDALPVEATREGSEVLLKARRAGES
jgi:hypothetical protein